ncbi:MAG: hypothetical protein WBA51_14820 [Erythrobacter sp.]
MTRSDLVGRFDLDLGLRDASLDPENRPSRRMLAAAAIGTEVNDAYYSAVELREAIEWVHDGHPGGKLKLSMILGNECDDYQRCLYFILAGRGIIQMLKDLDWLEELLEARGRVAGSLSKRGDPVMPQVRPYVASEPDGPLVAVSRDFREGPSWYLDPQLTE